MKRVGAITQPCTDGERLCFSPVDEKSCSHLVAKKSQDCGIVGRATKYEVNFPTSFTVGVEGVSHVSESHVKILVSFTRFLLNLPGHKEHVRGSSRCPECDTGFHVVCILTAGASGQEDHEDHSIRIKL